MSLSSKFTRSFSKQVMESYYSCNQEYAPWNPTPYQPHDIGYDTAPLNHCQIQGDAFLLCLDAKEDNAHFLNHGLINGEAIPTLYIHQERKKDSRLSQPLSNQWRSIPTLFRCANQKEREDVLVHEENVESLEQKGMHECLEEVEEENEYQEAEDIDQEVQDKNKGRKGIEIVHFTSSETTPPKLPSELHFKWANPYDMNCLSPQRYGLFKMDDQLKALYGVLDKKKMESMELVNRSSKNVMDSFTSFTTIKPRLGGLTEFGILEKASWIIILGGHTNFKHWWGFKDEFKHKPP
ncbi:hypothetical protein PIB30_037614 [Stylosanthes scabra]|uniref:Uncharacterized protein n=1 Tax=Stylosanthes scabra TaxID=79078 RepID=A0ABU6ZC57_9FABA|nr:hypothetical protein [Stylosanthes scabra]